MQVSRGVTASEIVKASLGGKGMRYRRGVAARNGKLPRPDFHDANRHARGTRTNRPRSLPRNRWPLRSGGVLDPLSSYWTPD